MLNFSKVEGSGLTAKDFCDQGIPHVEEVYEFLKYGKDGEVIQKGTSTYNVRFSSASACADWWKSVKSGEVKPVLNNILCKCRSTKRLTKCNLINNSKEKLDKP